MNIPKTILDAFNIEVDKIAKSLMEPEKKVTQTPALDPEVGALLKKNSNVPFVDRILNSEKYPVRKNPDGSTSTHLMGWGDADGKYFAYPALQYSDGKWTENSSPSSALKNKNVVWFDSKDKARSFAAGSWKPYMNR